MDLNTCLATTGEVRNLALYSHLIPAAATLILGLFAILRAQSRGKGAVFFVFTILFATWLVADLINWTTNSYALLAATWAPLDYINIVFFLLLVVFVYIDSLNKRPPAWLIATATIVAGVPFLITVSGSSVFEFNQPVCEMIGNEFLARYKFSVEMASLLVILVLAGVGMYTAKNDKESRIRIALIAGSIFLFLGTFAGAEYISTYTEVYEYMLYALFVLPIFVLLLTIAITRYGTFNLGDIAVRLLFYIFLVLAATQFFFVGDITEFLLASMSFSVVLTLGIMLFFTSEREMRQRMKIEIQEKELQLANQKQESLLHFISHEIKGYLTEGQNAFAGIIEGDFGEPAPKIKSVSETALTRMRAGVSTVMNILDASNLKKGTVTYTKEAFDLKDVVIAEVDKLKQKAAEKGLRLDLRVDEKSTFKALGDKEKIASHVIRNLVDNSIRYTPKGSVMVSLTKDRGSLRFTVTDTGVGITPDDMKRLFTEGGHGKDSIKVNVDSTGFGLFVAKQVVDAHNGKIWADSEGAGKGSEFVVELPAT